MQDLCTVINQVNKRVHRLTTGPKSRQQNVTERPTAHKNDKQKNKIEDNNNNNKKKKVASWQNNIGQEYGKGTAERESRRTEILSRVDTKTTSPFAQQHTQLRSIFIVVAVVPGIGVVTFHFSLHFHMGSHDQEEPTTVPGRERSKRENNTMCQCHVAVVVVMVFVVVGNA